MKNSYAHYIAGIFDGEGGVDKKVLTITNTHKHLIDIVSLYLTKLGINHKITKHAPQKKNYREYYRIKIYGRKNLDGFYTYIPFIHRDKRRKLLKELLSYKPHNLN